MPTNPDPCRRRARRLLAAAFFLLAAAAPLRALEPNDWRHRQAFTLDRTGVVRFALPPEALDAARPGGEDLRLLDAEGREVPFALERTEPAAPAARLAPRAFRAALLDAATQLTIETGETGPLEAVELVTPAGGFLKAVTVEVSADGRTWETVESGVPLFRQAGAEQLRIALGRRAAAHLRLTLDDARSRAVPVTGATLLRAPEAAPTPPPARPVRVARREEFAGESVLTLDLGARNLPLTAVEFVTAEALFARRVTLAVRDLQADPTGERVIARGSIYRLGVNGLPARARLELPVEATVPTRELIVHMENGDSPLLAIDAVRIRPRPVRIVLHARTAGRLTLLAGNDDTAAPHYDLAALAPALRDAPLVTPQFGPLEANPGFRRPALLPGTPLAGGPLDPAPWSYRKKLKLVAAGVQELELDPEVLARTSSGAPDLRLVRDGTQVPYVLERPSLSRALVLTPTAARDPRRPTVSRWELKLPRAGLPLTRLTAASTTALFQRQFRLVEITTDQRGAKVERTLGEATWQRRPGMETALLNLPVTQRPVTDTLVLETDDGDNPPITLTSVQAAHPVLRLIFRTDYAPLALYYGNARAAAPRYDLALIAPQLLTAERQSAALEPEEKLRPDSLAASTLAAARGGLVFWGVLGVVVVVLLVIVARLLPKPPAAGA